MRDRLKAQVAHEIRDAVEVACDGCKLLEHANQVKVEPIPGSPLEFHVVVRETAGDRLRFFLVKVSEPV